MSVVFLVAWLDCQRVTVTVTHRLGTDSCLEWGQFFALYIHILVAERSAIQAPLGWAAPSPTYSSKRATSGFLHISNIDYEQSRNELLRDQKQFKAHEAMARYG